VWAKAHSLPAEQPLEERKNLQGTCASASFFLLLTLPVADGPATRRERGPEGGAAAAGGDVGPAASGDDWRGVPGAAPSELGCCASVDGCGAAGAGAASDELGAGGSAAAGVGAGLDAIEMCKAAAGRGAARRVGESAALRPGPQRALCTRV